MSGLHLNHSTGYMSCIYSICALWEDGLEWLARGTAY